MKRRGILFAIAAWLVTPLILAGAQPAFADWKPNSTVEIVIPAGAGGGNDRTARVMAHFLTTQKLVTSSILIVNKPGAGGVIGQNYLNAHKGDGSYLMMTNPALVTNYLTGVGDARYSEVTPVAQLFTEYVLTVVRKESPLKSGRDIIDQLKKNPDSLTIGVAPGVGAGVHISFALVAKAAGITPTKLRIVPYATAAEVVTSLLGGHIDLMVTTPANVLPQLESGNARALAASAPSRLSGALANVPTWKEQGVDVVFGNWRGVAGPAGLTSEQTRYWDHALKQMVDSPEWQSELKLQSADTAYLDHAATAKYLDDENTRLKRVLEELGLAKRR